MKRALLFAMILATLVSGCRKKSAVPPNLNAANKVAVRLVQLYYESPRMLLAPEPRNVPVPESQAGAVPIVVRELMKGPTDARFGRLFPADTVVRGAYLLPGGTVVVDLGGVTLSRGWGAGSHQEILAAYSLVQTLSGNFSEAKRVRILVNGTPAETLAGHISLARSLSPRPALLDR